MRNPDQARAARLYRLLALLSQGPQTRAYLARRLRLGIRGFYRDLEVLRQAGIDVSYERGRHVLKPSRGKRAPALADSLPFPKMSLTLGEARQLAKGRTWAHRKLRAGIMAMTGVAASATINHSL